MPRLQVVLLEGDPHVVEELQGLLELHLEALEARPEVVPEPGLDLRGDLGHRAVDLLQELLRLRAQLLRELVLLAVEGDALLVLHQPRLPDDVGVVAEGEELRRRGQVLVVIAEAVVLLRVHLQVLRQQAHHVQEPRDPHVLVLRERVACDDGHALHDGDTLLQQPILPRLLELDHVRRAGLLGLLLTLLAHGCYDGGPTLPTPPCGPQTKR
mmetsp:Transcript_1150/g.3005  ORF Transcript_1150/g.3005 Transcript_1150/m.3005 type:complete len:212 (+) Transcript_1150:732-1367(+)